MKETREHFRFLSGQSPEKLFGNLPTPCYIIDEAALRRNGEILAGVIRRTGCKILLAQKAFSNYDFYPLLSEYLSGTEASGLYEARLGKECMPGKEVHVFCGAYQEADFEQIVACADHIVFNSPGQLMKYGKRAKEQNRSIRVENYLGIQALSGEELGERFRQHVLSENTPILEDEVTDIIQKEIWQVCLSSGRKLETKTLIYAAGMIPGELGIPGEKEYQGKGISYCAYCDGSLYKGKDTAVIGGGDTALDDALYLSDLCRKVYLIHRRNEFRGNNATVELLRTRENVEFILDASL